MMPNGSSEICMEYARLLDGWLSSGEMLRVEGDMVRHGLARCGECGGVHLVGDLVPVYSSEVVRGGRRVERSASRPNPVGAVCPYCAAHSYSVNVSNVIDLDSDGNEVEVQVRYLYHVDDNGDFGGRIMPQILSYDTNPLDYLRFKHTVAEQKLVDKGVPLLYLGAEIEAQVRNGTSVEAASQAVHGWMDDYAIMMRDGSVVNGFEIVTAPATLDFHVGGSGGEFGQGKLFSFDEKMGGPARLLRAFNTDCCGLHVHVSKNALTALDITKILMFVNCSANSDFIERISGRRPNRYCNRTEVEYSKEDILAGRGSLFKSVSNARQKYSMVNIGKPHTVEFRHFRGNVRAHGVFRAMEFVESLCYFVKTHTLKDCRNHNVYTQWLTSCNSRYRHLWLYLVHTGYITVPSRMRDNVSRWSSLFGIEQGDCAVVVVGGEPISTGDVASQALPSGGLDDLQWVSTDVAAEDDDDDDGEYFVYPRNENNDDDEEEVV